MHKLMIASANEELLIQNPYFCPDDDTTDLLVEMVERGVKIRIMVPGPVTDSAVVLHAGHIRFPRLLRCGVEIYHAAPRTARAGPGVPPVRVTATDRRPNQELTSRNDNGSCRDFG